jgi:hypothetical protein
MGRDSIRLRATAEREKLLDQATGKLETDTEYEAILTRLVSDGGEISPQDLDADPLPPPPFHRSTIYQALEGTT